MRVLLFYLGVFLFAAFSSVSLARDLEDAPRNSIGIPFVPIEPGSFRMGSKNGDWDEQPLHRVTISRSFYMGATEVTNAQYEQFDPAHKQLRGERGLSSRDDEAVAFVSWHDAVAFCKWLSKKETRPYRLPTEAEWEYACRAGTQTHFHMGDRLPEKDRKAQQDGRDPKPVSLQVGKTTPNAWGLYEMHGNVEEWCLDWYGPYEAGDQTNPVGRKTGDFRVVRGGSHNTQGFFLRSANRMGALPEDKHWRIGFRILWTAEPESRPFPAPPTPLWAKDVNQKPHDWAGGPDPDKPYFSGPICFVRIPPESDGPMFSKHNHNPALAWCPNGDLLAIWYSCRTETGRELCVVASRLRRGANEWDPASPFWDAPDRNDYAPALWHAGEGTIYHFNGLSAGSHYDENLALIMRVSKDNGATWSRARLINPQRGLPAQPATTVFRAQDDGRIVLPADAPSYREGGATALWMSEDNGELWSVTESGASGIHAGVLQLKDGRLLALGRSTTAVKRMPRSVSADMGLTWTRSDSEFPPISLGQRLLLMRLREGPILLVSFTASISAAKKGNPESGILTTDASGKERRVYGMFAALSFDEGETWPVKKLMTPGGPPQELDGGGHTHVFTLDDTHAEPGGYLAGVQTPDGIIHVISSALHYRLNLAWLQSP